MPTATAPKHPSETEKPEEHIREEALYKASTDLTVWDVSDAPKDLWVVESSVVVRADSEEGAAAKIAAGFGTSADVLGDVKARPAKAADLK